MLYTSDDLIDAIKRNVLVVKSQIKYTATDMLAFLNEELMLTILPRMMSMRMDYFVTYQDTALVANQSAYDIPNRAVGWKLEAVGYKDTDDNYTPLPQVTRAQRHNFSGMTTSTAPSAFFMLDDKVNIIPEAGSSVTGYLSFEFVRIQNQLVLESECGKVSSTVEVGADYQITVDSSPATTGDYVDVVGGINPFGILARQLSATVAGNVVTLPKATFSRIPVADDWVALYGQSPIPNIPEDFHPVLAQAAACRCVGGDLKSFQAATEVLNNMITGMSSSTKSRVNDSPKKIVSNNYVLNMMRRRNY